MRKILILLALSLFLLSCSSNDSQTANSSNYATSEYWASSHSNKYHISGCFWAQRINAENKITFSTKSEAEKADYVPCKVCEP